MGVEAPSLPFLCGLVPPGDSEKNLLVPRFFLLFSLLAVPYISRGEVDILLLACDFSGG
jgi:hypothetical protein